MRTFRYKPLPKTDTLLRIQLQTYYYEVAILFVMFGITTTMVHENRQFTAFLQQRRFGLFFPLQMLTVRALMLLLYISKFGTYSSHCLRENLFTDRQTDTHTQTDYNNPPRACARVNNLRCERSYKATMRQSSLAMLTI